MANTLLERRFKALIIDIGILMVIHILITILFMLVVSSNLMYNHVMTSIIVYGLFFCKDMVNGQSVGKRLLKLQVVSDKGGAVTLPKLIARNLVALVQPIDALFMINNQGRRWGDILCKTQVVYAAKTEAIYK